MHLTNLFPKYKATATAMLVGSFQLSFNIFYIFVSYFHYQSSLQSFSLTNVLYLAIVSALETIAR